MASCLVPDFPAVLLALEHLGELEKKLKDEDASIGQEACHHLREISSAIKELEASRKAVHEQLEIETIENSKVRHQLLRTRDEIANEIGAGVEAVRDVSAKELNQLQADLTYLQKEIGSLEAKQAVLEEENKHLHTEREQKKRNHENVISLLNYQLSEKAGHQIRLNAKLNEIEDVKAKMADVELARADLSTDMTEERNKFNEAKDAVEAQIEEQQQSIQQQKQANFQTRRQHDALTTELHQREDREADLRSAINQIEMSKTRLVSTRKILKAKLEENLEKKKDLDRTRVLHEKELAKIKETFRKKQEALLQSIAETEKETELCEGLHGIQIASINRLTERFNIQRKLEDDTTAEHNAMSRRLQWSKLKLEERIASIAKYKIEIKEMEEAMRQLKDTTEVNSELFVKNLKEMELQLVREKKARASCEDEKEKLAQDVEDLKVAHQESMRQVRQDTQKTEERSQQLREEVKSFQAHEYMTSLIDRLKKMVSDTEEAMKDLELSTMSDIKEFEEESALLTQERLELEELLKAEEVVLAGVEGEFDIDQSRHQALTKDTTDQKYKKMQLELTIQDTQDATAWMIRPKEELKVELIDLRRKYVDMLRSQGKKIGETERAIYDRGVMLEQVNRENARLYLRISQMKEEVSLAEQDKKRHSLEAERLQEQDHFLFQSLLDAWANDLDMTKEHNDKDHEIYQSLQNLIMKLQRRQNCLGGISNRVREEFEGLTSLLFPPKIL
ncbi:rho-associated protein kinase 1 [Engraulis encrasicolus]|uniref:rho-associated protein kinase 1 n=1 Tax=Engraulis encrasicolus TaxID=184585 RepID=UPI002FD75774